MLDGGLALAGAGAAGSARRARVAGMLHPGEMGAAVGQCLTGAGYEVLWASEGRGPDTAARAREAGLTDVGTVSQLAARASVILSICPPHAALDVAEAVRGFSGLYMDANAISLPRICA